MKNFKKLLAVIIAVVLICLQIPMGVFAADGIEWSTTNLVEGQGDIVLNGYNPAYLDVTLDGDTGYRLDYTITFNTNVAGHWNYMSNMLRQSESDLISFGAWNDAGDGTGQLRFAENDISNASQTAVEGVGVIAAGVGYPISIVIMPDYVELYVAGQLQTMYLTSGGTATQIPVSKRIADGKIGFIGQGSHPDITISDIALYCESGAEEPVEPEIEWSDNNIVAGQPNLTLDYFWKWMTPTIKGSESYKYSFDIIASNTEGYRFPTVAVRDVSANSDGTDGLYVVFNNADDQIRIGYENTTNSSLIAVATNAGFKPAGTYKVDIITTPNAIEVYMNGNLMTFTDMVSGTYQSMTQVPTKEFADAKAGFITQGNVLDTQITDIAIYRDKNVEAIDTPRWSETNMVDGFPSITLTDYFWDSIPGHIYADASYKYNFNVNTTTTEGYLLPTFAVRDSSAATDGSEGLFIVFNVMLDQIRIGYEYTTDKALIAVATASNYGVVAGANFDVEVITTPTTIEVFVDGTPVVFIDMLDGYQSKTVIPVSGLKDGKAGFNAQGTVLDTVVSDFAVYTEFGKEQITPIVFSTQNTEAYVGDEFDVVISVDSNPGIISAKLDVAYDSNVFELVGVKEGDFDKTIESLGENINCYNFGDITANPFAVNWVNPFSKNIFTNGTFAIVTFRVKDDAAEGNYDISIVPDNTGNIFNAKFNDIPAETITATVGVKGKLAGDVNGDRSVDNKDLALLMQYMSNWNVEIDLDVADVDSNGKIGNKDYALIMRYINGWDVQLG